MTDPLCADVQAAVETIQSVTWPDTMPHPPTYGDTPMTHAEVEAIIQKAAEQACYAYAERLLAALVEAFAENEPLWKRYDRIESDLEAVRKLREPA